MLEMVGKYLVFDDDIMIKTTILVNQHHKYPTEFV